MPVIFSIDTVRKGKNLNIELLSEEDSNNIRNQVSISLNVTIDGMHHSLVYEFSKEKDQLQVRNILAFGGVIGCLAGCGIALAGPIYDCWRKSKGKKDDFLICLDENSGTLSTSAYLCIINCMQ